MYWACWWIACVSRLRHEPYKIFMRVKCREYWEDEDVRSPFGGLNQGIKGTSKLLNIKGSRMHSCNLTFDPWKSSNQEPQKGMIKRSNTPFANQKTWSWSQTLQLVTYKWLPLAVTKWISENDQHLEQRSQMKVTDYSTWVSGWTLQNLGVTREMQVSWKVCWVCTVLIFAADKLAS